eukprot:223435_1
MAAFDSLVTSVCIICLFQIGDSLYAKSCGKCCDAKCNTLCKYFALHLFKTSIDKDQKTAPEDDDDMVQLEVVVAAMPKLDLKRTESTTRKDTLEAPIPQA